MATKFITLNRAKDLEVSIGWLSNYQNKSGEKHVIGNSLEDIDAEATEKLKQLSKLNKERESLLTWFKQY